MLTDRQRTAQAIARELQRMGAWVTSPMPLDRDGKLRFQVLDKDRDAILARLSQWNWTPALLSAYPRICSDGMLQATLYEIDLPRERQAIPQDDRIHGEF